ncbi:MAG: hypothetical protein BGO50_17285 [Rhodanobacter sp. 67-28]|nr:MAG: hypothetical protein BGO50_17285 [Rhodanobacter sp. 67-28]
MGLGAGGLAQPDSTDIAQTSSNIGHGEAAADANTAWLPDASALEFCINPLHSFAELSPMVEAPAQYVEGIVLQPIPHAE